MKLQLSARPFGLLALALISGMATEQSASPASAKDPPLTAEQQERLQERNRLVAEAGKLWQAGKHAQAIALREKVVALQREIFGAGHEQVAVSLRNLAWMHEARDDLPAAVKARQEVLAILTKLYGDRDWRVTDARWDLELLKLLAGLDAEARRRLRRAEAANREVVRLRQAGRPREALPLMRQALAIRKELLGEAHPHYAASLNSLATLYWALGEYGKALPLHERARDLRKRLLGEAHPLYAQSLSNLAGLYQALGEYGKALPLFEQARDLTKRLGEAHPDYAASLNNLALLYQALGEYGKALPLFEQARDLCKRLLGEAHAHYATSLNNLASVYQDLGEYGKALPLYEQARDLRKRLLGETHPHYAQSLSSLALLYQAMGEYGKALPLYQQTRDLTKRLRGKAHPAYATSLNNLALLYQALGEYDNALSLYEQARDLRKRVLGEAHPDYANSLHNLAGLYQALGEYGMALPLLEQARDLCKRVLGEAHPHYATSLNNLALLYQALGEYGKALPLLEQARDLRKRVLGEAHPDYANSLHNLGTLHHDMREYGKALPLLEQARDLCKRVLGEAHPHYATSLNDLAGLYQDLGEYGKALPLYQQARDLYKRVLGEAHPHYAQNLNDLASLYWDLGEYGKALPLLEQARDLRKRLLGEAHPAYAQSLNNLASLYGARGEYGKALPLFEQARDLRKRLGEAHPDYAASLNNLAMLYRAMGKTAQAAQVAEQSRALRQRLLDRTFTHQSSRQRSNLLGQHRYALDVYLSFGLDAGTAPAPLYEAALAWKGALAARAAEERLWRDRPELRPLAQKLRLARASLARVASRQPANERQQAEWRALFDRLEAEKEDLETRLAQQSAAYLRSLKLRQADATQVRAALPRGVALVDFLEYRHWSPSPTKKGRWKVEARLLAFVLTRERPPALVPLGPAKEIGAAVQAWRRAVQANQDPGPVATELARRVWQPLRPHLSGAHTALLAPDGVLCGLSFAALPGGKAHTFLIEEVALGYVTSGRHPLELAAADDGPRGQGLLAVGGLSYGAAPAALPRGVPKRGYPDLPGTRTEAERLGQLFRQHFPGTATPRLLTGAAADADALQRLLDPAAGKMRPRYLHLATHGFFEPPSPEAVKLRWPAEEPLLPFDLAKAYRTYTRNPLLLCGLVLAGANRDPERGILRGEAVAELDLRGCELAVLSACETGLGKVAGAEGVQSLQRAFQAAGARALVVSLWKVEDAATSVLMEEFYTNLWRRQLPRLEALRQAQLTVLRNPGRVRERARELRGIGNEAAALPGGGRIESGGRSRPASWAAFVLSGDPGDLSSISLPTAVPEPDPPQPQPNGPATDPEPTGWSKPVVVAAGVLGLALLVWLAASVRRRWSAAAARR
jgi:tetratricopeptide (TPR) repeat protein